MSAQSHQTPASLIRLLGDAEGVSQSMITIIVDIRGFTKFTNSADSVEVAWYLKRTYKHILETYFKDAKFCKPTGDGLIICYHAPEKQLSLLANTLSKKVFEMINTFPKTFINDPIITFDVPTNLGVAMTRGVGCELRSGKQIIDFSAKHINLASRLQDYARPKGVILDHSFLSLLESDHPYIVKEVYIEGFSEDFPTKILTSPEIELPAKALKKMGAATWKSLLIETIQFKDLLKRGSRFHHDVPVDLVSGSEVQAKISYPSYKNKRKEPGITSFFEESLEIIQKANKFSVVWNYESLHSHLLADGVRERDNIIVELTYLGTNESFQIPRKLVKSNLALR